MENSVDARQSISKCNKNTYRVPRLILPKGIIIQLGRQSFVYLRHPVSYVKGKKVMQFETRSRYYFEFWKVGKRVGFKFYKIRYIYFQRLFNVM